MSAPIKVSTPSVDVQGLSFVQVGDGVNVHYRNANGDLSEAVVKFWDNGNGIGLFLNILQPGSVFVTDSNGRIQLAS